MNSCQEQADVLLNRSRASLNRSSLKSRPSWGTDRTSETFSRPTSTRLTFQSQSQRESLLTGADGGQVQYQKYKWSKDSSFRSRCMDVPRSFSFFLRNLSNAFGWKFVIMVLTCSFTYLGCICSTLLSSALCSLLSFLISLISLVLFSSLHTQHQHTSDHLRVRPTAGTGQRVVLPGSRLLPERRAGAVPRASPGLFQCNIHPLEQ